MNENYYIYRYSKLEEASTILQEAWVGDDTTKLIRRLLLLLHDAGCKDEERMDVRKIADVEVFHVNCKNGDSWIFSPAILNLKGLKLIKKFECPSCE